MNVECILRYGYFTIFISKCIIQLKVYRLWKFENQPNRKTWNYKTAYSISIQQNWAILKDVLKINESEELTTATVGL